MDALVYQTSPIKRIRSTKAEVRARRQALFEIAEEAKPATVRQIYYQATVRGIVEKTEAGYTKVQTDLVQMRRSGQMPYSWLADNTRWQRKPDTFSSIQQALEEHLPPSQLRILKAAEESERLLLRTAVDQIGGAL